MNAKYDDIEVFCGTEMDILPDGTFDFDDEILEQLDFVIASIHSSFNQPQEKIMERFHAALKNPHVHMIAHPTGRIIGQREGYNPDDPTAHKMGERIRQNTRGECKSISFGFTHRILKPSNGKWCPYSDQYRCACDIEQLRHMDIGVEYAQKAWLQKKHSQHMDI